MYGAVSERLLLDGPVPTVIRSKELVNFTASTLNWSQSHFADTAAHHLHVANETVIATLPIGQVSFGVPDRPVLSTIRSHGVFPTHEQKSGVSGHKVHILYGERNIVISANLHRQHPILASARHTLESVVRSRHRPIILFEKLGNPDSEGSAGNLHHLV